MLSLSAPHMLFMMHRKFCIVWLHLILWGLLPSEVLAPVGEGSKLFYVCTRSVLPELSFCFAWIKLMPCLLHGKSLLNSLKQCGDVSTYLHCIASVFQENWPSWWFYHCRGEHISILLNGLIFFSFLKELLCTRNYWIMQVKPSIYNIKYFSVILNLGK